MMENTELNIKKKSYTSRNIIIGILTALLLSSLAYNYFQNNEKEEMTEKMNDKIEATIQEKDELKLELENLNTELITLKELNESKDSVLNEKIELLESKKFEIEKLINEGSITKNQLIKLKDEISSLRSQISQYKNEIKNLQLQNDTLRVKVDTLNREKNAISELYNQEKTSNQQKQNLIESTLSTSNFSITPYKVRKSGKEVEKETAKRIDKLKVNFDLDANNNALSETKTLYISIYKPGGQLAKFNNATTGTFLDKSGKSVEYSDRINIPYNSENGSKVSFDWDYNEFVAGNYRISVYQNGFKIGENQVNLK